MIWACSAAVGIHLALVLAMAQLEGAPGAGGVVAAHTVSVRYVSDAADASKTAGRTEELGAHGGLITEPSTQAAVPTASTIGADGTTPREYFDVSDVDEPASPVPDWSLDPAFLVRNGVRSLKIDVLISDAGRPERCTVTSMVPARQSLVSVIERQLCRTHLTPALRRGVAVPSIRHIEILLSQD